MILLLQVGATWFMTGLIWFVQVVHYPLFGSVGGEAFVDFHPEHVRRTTWVVGPPMLVEAVCAVATVLRPPPGVPPWQTWLGLAMLVFVWLSTAFLQVPRHRWLERGFDRLAHRRLVATNWLRVLGWSGRAVLVTSWLV